MENLAMATGDMMYPIGSEEIRAIETLIMTLVTGYKPSLDFTDILIMAL